MRRDDDNDSPIIPVDLTRKAIGKFRNRTVRDGIMLLPAVFKVPATEGPRDTSGVNEYDAMVGNAAQLRNNVTKKRITKSRIALEEMMAGGETRQAIYPRIRERLEAEWGAQARIDQVPQVVYQLLQRIQAKGWTVESMWRVVPPGGKRFIPDDLDDLDDDFWGISDTDSA